MGGPRQSLSPTPRRVSVPSRVFATRPSLCRPPDACERIRPSASLCLPCLLGRRMLLAAFTPASLVGALRAEAPVTGLVLLRPNRITAGGHHGSVSRHSLLVPLRLYGSSGSSVESALRSEPDPVGGVLPQNRPRPSAAEQGAGSGARADDGVQAPANGNGAPRPPYELMCLVREKIKSGRPYMLPNAKSWTGLATGKVCDVGDVSIFRGGRVRGARSPWS